MYKKLSVVMVAVLMVCSFSSCIKGFTCTCEASTANYTGKQEKDLAGTKKTAQMECDDMKEEMAESTGVTPTCTLK